MSTAIETKYLGPTNTKGSRIKAWTRVGSIFGPPSYIYYSLGMRAENIHQSHINAAKRLAEKLDWQGTWYVGDTHAGIVAVRLPAYEDAAGANSESFRILPPVERMEQGEVIASMPTSSDTEDAD